MTAPESATDGLLSAVGSGDARRALEAQRDDIARRLEVTDSGRDAAALHGRLSDVLDRLAALPAPKEGTALDELARRRAAAAGDGVASRSPRAGRASV